MHSSLLFVSALAAVAFSAILQQPIHKFASVRQASSGKAPIMDYYDDFYLTHITLGTPAQPFAMMIDTGTADLWVVGAACQYQSCTGTNYTRSLFDTRKSSTLEWLGTTFEEDYGHSAFSGDLATDTITVGGLSFDTQEIIVVNSLGGNYAIQPIDGVMGLGWPELSNTGTPVMQNLLPQLDKPLFTVWLDRHVKPSEGKLGGLITYGAIDTVNCDAQVNYVTLTIKAYWKFSLNGFQFGDYSDRSTAQAISDTGDSFIRAPATAFNAVADATGARYEFDSGSFIVPCIGTYPDLVFTIGGNAFTVPSTEYINDVGRADGTCQLMVIPRTDDSGFVTDWVLGDPWIRTYCNIYDIGGSRIGFARAHHTEI